MAKQEEHMVSMSLGDHLEELRTRLILAICGVFLGLVICMFFGKYLIGVLLIPYDNAMEEITQTQIEKAAKEGTFADPNEAVANINYSLNLTSVHPAEGFMVFIKTSLIFGLLLTSPWVFWQIWAFVASGLYKREKKFAYAVAPASAVLFISGSIFFITAIAPLTMKFFVTFNQYLGFASQFRPQDYINMILALTLIFGVAFQMPIVVVFAERMGLVTIEMLTKNRKFVILGLVVLSAMVTPPDLISQVGLAGPLYLLYEISIIACRVIRKRKEQQAAIEEYEDDD